MSAYPPPLQFLPTFNQGEFNYYSSYLTYTTGDARYLKISGGIASGLITFNAGLTSVGAVNITNTTQSTNTSTGSLIIAGGLGVAKNSHFGGTIHVPRGSAGAPSYAFIPDPTTGIFSFGSGQLNIATSGLTRLSIASSTMTSTLSVVAPSGSATDCAYQLSAGAGCGLYSSGADTINFATAGANRLTLSSSGYLTLATGQLVVPAGSATTPSISWPSASINSGIYLVGADNVGFSADGVLRADYNTTRWLFSQPIQLQTTGGTASNLDYYEELTHSSSWTYTGATIPSFNFLLRRIGKMVSVQLTTMGVAYRNTGGASKLTLTTALPTRFRPSETIYMPIAIEVNANTSHRTIAINSTGIIDIGEVNTSAFGINTDLRVLACSYTFTLS